MLITKVGKPSTPNTGDVWFDPTTRETKICMGSVSGNSTYSWVTLLPLSTMPPNPPLGYIHVDAISRIPSLWDGASWIPAVPTNYQFPPLNPQIGAVWIEPMSQVPYVFLSSGWIPFSSNLNASQIQSASVPSLPPIGLPVGNWQQIVQPNNIAQSVTNGLGSTTTQFTITGPNGDLVMIDTVTGNITYGPNYTPDAAAQIFWRAIAGTSPRFMQTRIDELVKDLKDVTTRLAVAEGEVLKFRQAGYNVPEPPQPFDPMDAWNRAMGIIK